MTHFKEIKKEIIKAAADAVENLAKIYYATTPQGFRKNGIIIERGSLAIDFYETDLFQDVENILDYSEIIDLWLDLGAAGAFANRDYSGKSSQSAIEIMKLDIAAELYNMKEEEELEFAITSTEVIEGLANELKKIGAFKFFGSITEADDLHVLGCILKRHAEQVKEDCEIWEAVAEFFIEYRGDEQDTRAMLERLELDEAIGNKGGNGKAVKRL